MGNGKKVPAPCGRFGHEGEIVIGTYAQCPICDFVPDFIIPEVTEKIWLDCNHHHTTVNQHGDRYGVWCDDCGRFLRKL
jgi:hypothetical protein